MTLVKVGDQISIRASNLTRRTFVEKFLEAVPRKLVQNYIATGRLSGELLAHPVIQGMSKAFGISAEAAAREFVNVAQVKLRQ